MGRQSRIGHNQRQILTVLYDYSERYPQQWVPHYRIIDDLKMDESIFSRAIQGLVEPPNSRNDFKPLVEMTHPTIAYREFQGEVIPLPDNATMGDALFAMKFAWEGNTAQHNFYRITDLGVERLVRIRGRTHSKPSIKPTKSAASSSIASQKIS
ncbi:MAG: hypothetical protein HKP52_13530 [Desulfofustis sp.]|nr:hypothetical protein [Desulfofustis sp.]